MSIPAQPSIQSPMTGRVDFGWIGQAWTLFSARPGVWVGAILLFFLVSAAAWFLLALPTGQLAAMQRTYAMVVTHTLIKSTVNPYQQAAQTRLLSILVEAVTAVFTGGLYRMALRQRRGEPISAAGLFSAFPVALPLLIVGAFVPAVLGLLEGTGIWLLHFSLTPVRSVSVADGVVSIPGLLIRGVFMFAPLLVVDAGSNAPKALSGSIRLLRGQIWRGIGFHLIATLLVGAGAILCGIGILATYPLLFLSIAIGYLALTQPETAAPPAFDPEPLPGVWPPPPRRQ